MDAANSAQFFEGQCEVSEEDFMPFVDEKTEEWYIDNYDEPGFFSRVQALVFSSVFLSELFYSG